MFEVEEIIEAWPLYSGAPFQKGASRIEIRAITHGGDKRFATV